ncbi:hypothetical protein [Proteiniphilum propionicum]|uniref:hypothetical protein n=1 Tax=Proteiniphilum propionicum TaxID=2829812 RepID=UPI001EEB1BD8|nr:hypothetical protein [Proteiniphilum propionicum]
MQTNILGYPRIGNRRELKKACESFWAGKITEDELFSTGRSIRQQNRILQKEAGIDLIPSNDFSFYDQVLDTTLAVGAIPTRYDCLRDDKLALYFAMARGYQQGEKDITAMEMTKWFDTNYHYIVPEFTKTQAFSLIYNKALEEYKEGREQGIETKPVLPGPVSYLLSGKEKEEGFHRLELLGGCLKRKAASFFSIKFFLKKPPQILLFKPLFHIFMSIYQTHKIWLSLSLNPIIKVK